MFRKIGLIVGCLVCGMILLSACSSNALSEAKQTVAQADSVWAEGGMYSDSLSLAQAYETLSSFNYPLLSTLNSQLSTDFVHACYHYGKLLRAKDDPVAAMQVFINATHAGSDDKQILGRIYNNMGDICHRANEFSLSYDMFKRSADVFLSDKDTLSYYYCLNDMAFELAEQGKKEETYTILDNILINCKDRDIYLKTIETRAVACKLVHQYDSTIYYTSLSFKYGCYAKNILLNRAQAYSKIGQRDSAVYYANVLIRHTDELFYKNSALYILTHEDDKKDIKEIRDISAERSDTQKLIEIRQGKLSQAVQLLEQELNRKPDYRWLYAILLSLVLIGASIYVYNYRKRCQHALLSQQIDDLAIQSKEAEAQREKIICDIEKHKRTITDEIEKNCKLIIKADSFPQNIYWNKYRKMCSTVDNRFYLLASKLHAKYKLNETETRLCVLTLLDCKYDLIAELLYRSSSSIGTLKIRVAKKLGTTAKDLRVYLIDNECIG